MGTFYFYLGIVCVLMFGLICTVSFIVEKEKKDPVFALKMDRIRGKWKKIDPFTNFFTNLFWWVFALLIIYFIYLGGSN